jgi:tight adherence protein B
MTPLLIRLLILVAIFASVFLISQLVGRLILNRQAERTAVNRRLSMLRSGIDRETVAGTLLKNAPPMLSPEAGLPERVMMTALPIEARQLSLTMGIGFCVIVAILLLLAWSAEFSLSLGVVLLVTVIAGAIAVGIPLMIISRMAQSRRKKMEEQFPLSLDIFTRSLRVGHPIASAIHLITEEMADPIGSEFGLVHDEVAYGAELTDALAAMAERWDLEDMRMFVVSVSVQSETGGNLAEILENLSQVIRARAAMYMKVRALSSEGRMTAWMLTALPVITLVSLFIVNPGFYFDVAQDPIFLIGFPSLILLYVTGVLIIRRMVDLKV